MYVRARTFINILCWKMLRHKFCKADSDVLQYEKHKTECE